MVGSQSSLLDEPPEPNMEKYSNNIVKKISGLHVFIQEFFKENVERAKTRNERYSSSFHFIYSKVHG